jgi:FdhD protein
MTSVERTVLAVEKGSGDERADLLAEESPIELRLGGVPLAVLMRTPGHDVDLARGFALTEGIVIGPEEIASVDPVDDGDRYELRLAEGVEVDPSRFQRSTFVSSSCGVCGKASIDAVRIAARRPPPGPMLDPELPRRWIDSLTGSQPGFYLTGGLHAAAICEPDGTVLGAAEDVGRHNAVDKAVGRVTAARWPLGEVVLAVSGRISFEIAQKAAVAGIPVVAGVSAASSLAADLADELGMTLIGFVRQDRFVVYAGHDRFPDDALPTA